MRRLAISVLLLLHYGTCSANEAPAIQIGLEYERQLELLSSEFSVDVVASSLDRGTGEVEVKLTKQAPQGEGADSKSPWLRYYSLQVQANRIASYELEFSMVRVDAPGCDGGVDWRPCEGEQAGRTIAIYDMAPEDRFEVIAAVAGYLRKESEGSDYVRDLLSGIDRIDSPSSILATDSGYEVNYGDRRDHSSMSFELSRSKDGTLKVDDVGISTIGPE